MRRMLLGASEMTIEDYRKKLSSMKDIIYFDQHHFLREKTTHLSILEQLIAEGEELLTLADDAEKECFLHGTLGNLYRICGELKKAIAYLKTCLNQAKEEGNVTREVVSLIRYGEALKYAGK